MSTLAMATDDQVVQLPVASKAKDGTGAMPEAKVAAMDSTGGRLKSLPEAGVKYSVIDGLQRLFCYCIAILLVWKREKLIEDRSIPSDAWDYFKESVEKTGDPKAAVEQIL